MTTVREQINALTPTERQKVLDSMWGYPRQLFEVRFDGWRDYDNQLKKGFTSTGVVFGVSAKTANGARLKVLEFFELQNTDLFKPEVVRQL